MESARIMAGRCGARSALASTAQHVKKEQSTFMRMINEKEAFVASNPLLAKLLSLAQRAKREGNSRQATEMYWGILDKHPGTAEAATSKNELLAIAEGHERAGNVHMARSMYERLMDLEA